MSGFFRCRVARRDIARRPAEIAINLPLEPMPAELAGMFGDRFDSVVELMFGSTEQAVAVLMDMQADHDLRSHAATFIDQQGSSHWLAEVVPQYEVPGTGIKFVVAGQTAGDVSVEEAQRYWCEVHPVVFRAVPDFMEYITRYVQMHGRDVPALRDFVLLGRNDFYPMCADMGLRTIADLPVAYSLPSYLAIIRPDEKKFSRPEEMLSFASQERIVFS